MVKSRGGQRKSDGVVVPPIGVEQNAPGGKGPDFGHAGRGGKRKGMAGTARPNHPGGACGPADLNRLRPVRDDVRRLQRKLWAAAKQSPERRFHALYDRIYRGDVLMEAWKRVRVNKGAAGVDKQTPADVEVYGVQRMLDEIAADLRAGTYRPAPARRRATKFNQLDWYVVGRLRRLLTKRYGRNLHAGRVEAWTREWFERHGLYRLRGTVRYPKAA